MVSWTPYSIRSSKLETCHTNKTTRYGSKISIGNSDSRNAKHNQPLQQKKQQQQQEQYRKLLQQQQRFPPSIFVDIKKLGTLGFVYRWCCGPMCLVGHGVIDNAPLEPAGIGFAGVDAKAVNK